MEKKKELTQAEKLLEQIRWTLSEADFNFYYNLVQKLQYERFQELFAFIRRKDNLNLTAEEVFKKFLKEKFNINQ